MEKKLFITIGKLGLVTPVIPTIALFPSGVAKPGYTGACAPATGGCAPPVQVLLKIVSAECTIINRELGAKSAQRC